MVLPIRAIMPGDVLPFGRQVVAKQWIGPIECAGWVELELSDGSTFTGDGATTLTVEEVSVGSLV